MPARILPEDVKRAAETCGCEEPAIRAVLDVECKGNGFVSHRDQEVPVILFEPHVFYQRSGPYPISRDFPHLSSKKWNRALYNRTGRKVKDGENTQHVKLEEASALDAHYETGADLLRRAAHESCSWGIGQVMGYHWEGLGYPSIDAFLDAMRESEGTQLDAMVRFIKVNGLLDALRGGKRTADTWRKFAKGYNGAGYEANGYHTKLAEAYRKHSDRA